jgi:hypothetical protein
LLGAERDHRGGTLVWRTHIALANSTMAKWSSLEGRTRPGSVRPKARTARRPPSSGSAGGGGESSESVKPSRYEVRPDLKDLTFSEGGPKAWFVVVRRMLALWPSMPAGLTGKKR